MKFHSFIKFEIHDIIIHFRNHDIYVINLSLVIKVQNQDIVVTCGISTSKVAISYTNFQNTGYLSKISSNNGYFIQLLQFQVP